MKKENAIIGADFGTEDFSVITKGFWNDAGITITEIIFISGDELKKNAIDSEEKLIHHYSLDRK